MAVEEEFQILDPRTLALEQRFEELRDAAPAELDIRGELIRSEIEITTEKCPDFATAARAASVSAARELFVLTRESRAVLGVTATHPFSSWKDQRIIDTPHYRLVEELAQVRGLAQQHVELPRARGRARRRPGGRGVRRHAHLPAAPAGAVGELARSSKTCGPSFASARVQTFVRMFPRCGVPDVFGDWSEHRRFVTSC